MRPSEDAAVPTVRPRVLVTVGTDHHPFDRLVEWVNEWLARHPEQLGTFFVQWGASSARPACAGSPFLTARELEALLDQAVAVVCHGGPGSIAGAWARGLTPVAVPRQQRLGEHVDDHQVEFCAKVAESGRVRLALTREAFGECLEQALSGQSQDVPAISLFGSHESEIEETVARFGKLVENLVNSRGRRLPLTDRIRRRPRPRGEHDPRTRVAGAVAFPGPPALVPRTSHVTAQVAGTEAPDNSPE